MALPLPPPSLLQPPVIAAVAISKCGSGRRVDRGFPHCCSPRLLPQQSKDLGPGPEWELWPPPPDTSHCVSGWRWAEAGAGPPRLSAPEGAGRPPEQSRPSPSAFQERSPSARGPALDSQLGIWRSCPSSRGAWRLWTRSVARA